MPFNYEEARKYYEEGGHHERHILELWYEYKRLREALKEVESMGRFAFKEKENERDIKQNH